MSTRPTLDVVRAEGLGFDQDPSTQLTEAALEELRAHHPRNTVTSQVLLKVLVLNELYNTRVRDIDVETLARHITRLEIDPMIVQGSRDAVNLIINCGGLQKYYSFATKYCSWHNPTAYPIYDGNVDECLWHFKKLDQFAKFSRQDLACYDRLVEVVVAFRNFYELESLTFKQLDKYLWRCGARILKQKERNRR